MKRVVRIVLVVRKGFPCLNAVEEPEQEHAHAMSARELKAIRLVVNDVLHHVLRNTIKDSVGVGELPLVKYRILGHQRSPIDACEEPLLPTNSEPVKVHQSLTGRQVRSHRKVVSLEPIHAQSFMLSSSNASKRLVYTMSSDMGFNNE